MDTAPPAAAPAMTATSIPDSDSDDDSSGATTLVSAEVAFVSPSACRAAVKSAFKEVSDTKSAVAWSSHMIS